MIDTVESMTAKLCSFARAYHSNYAKQKIFDDHLAYDMMGREEYEEIGQLIEKNFEFSEQDINFHFSGENVYPITEKYISPIPLSRIAFAESALAYFADKNSPCQYVICGAGMDTFAFRNENANIKIFELDHPDTQRYKLERIRALEWNIGENVKYVPIDFEKDNMENVLECAGFSRNIPSFFAILGVTYYLELPVFEKTIEMIGGLACKDSQIVFDFPDETTFSENASERIKYLTQITAKLGEPMSRGSSVIEIREMLQRHGFDIFIHETPETIQKKFFKGINSQKAFENIHFILANKK